MRVIRGVEVVPGALTLALVMLGAACSRVDGELPDGGAPPAEPGTPDDPDAPTPDAGIDAPLVADGAARYATLCAGCHGGAAEGGVGPRLAGWLDDGRTEDELVAIIDERMPPGDEEACDGTCASAIAAWILTLPGHEPAACDDGALPARRALRLLTRSEISRTVRDLFADVRPTCATSLDCVVSEQTCGADGRCHVDTCRTRTFSFDPAGRTVTSVSLAGSFTGWQPTPMVLGADGRYVVKRELADGTHAYKFVMNGSEWLHDAGNPLTEPDGFGGSNSLVAVACAGAPAVNDDVFGREWARAFPIESRPQHHPFDNAAGLVTDALVDASTGMAAEVVRLVSTDLGVLAPCLAVAEPSTACVEGFVRDFGLRAYRRPLHDDEVTRLVALAQAEGSADGVSVVLEVMLSSPQFLYRTELGVEEPAGSGRYRLTPWEIASALSYGLTGSMPDDALLAAAGDGSLDTAEDVQREARRLLTTEAARRRLSDVALQWLGVESLPSVTKSAQFADFTPGVRAAMLDEVRRFFQHVVFDGSGSLDELFTSDRTFLSPSLAAFYGVPAGELVPAPDGRRGVLGQGALLATLAYPDQTSPPRRGVFVRERVLCQELGTPPANAGAVPDVDQSGTTRERFEEHSSRAECFACHQYIDGVGFGFERYDAVGRWRDLDDGHPIDASGDMTSVEALGDGTSAPFSSVAELADVIVESDRAAQCFATQMYRWVHGRHDTESDRCALERLGGAFRGGGRDIQTLLVDVLRDEAFLVRRRGGP